MARVCLLPDRSVFEIDGLEAKKFLQDLLTNNLDLVSPSRAIYTCLLTPQGKYLFDFFLVEKDGKYLVDCARERAPQLLQRLMFYKLRAAVELQDLSDSWAVGTIFDGDKNEKPGMAGPLGEGVRFQDPRLGDLGTRFLVPASTAEKALDELLHELGGQKTEPLEYEQHRLMLGVPGDNDLVPEKTFPMEANLDLLNAIDFHKGCFVGQEVTSRTFRQGKIRKRILPIRAATSLPPPGTPIMAGERQAGDMLSSHGTIGLGLVRLDRLDLPLEAAGVSVDVSFPHWLPNPAQNEEAT